MRLLLVAVLCVAASCAYSAKIFDAELDNMWLSYKSTHGKSYESMEEETNRRLIWESNVRLVHKHNMEASLGKHTYTVKMNKYGDLSNKEFRAMMNGFNMTAHKLAMQNKKPLIGHPFENPTVDVPDSVDWRTQGYVT